MCNEKKEMQKKSLFEQRTKLRKMIYNVQRYVFKLHVT